MGITRQQALDCLLSDDLIGLGMEADAVRRHLHPTGVATYVVQQTIDVAAPGFERSVQEAVDRGATGLTLEGKLNDVEAWENLLSELQSRFPRLWLNGLSATDVLALASGDGRAVEQVIARLRAAGLQSLSGGDAGMLPLPDPSRCGITAWLGVHRAAHRLGLPSTASMRFGAGETPEQRAEHLDALRQLQEETGGFVSFDPHAAPLPNFEEATAVDYLKTLAVARVFLDNVPHVQADWTAQGLKVLQMALRFGADDAGSALPYPPLPLNRTTEEDLRRVIRGAGLSPIERDPSFGTMFLD